MHLVMMMYEESDLEGRVLAGVCEWNQVSIRAVVECARVAAKANAESAAVKHVAFDALSADVYEVYYNDAEQVVTDNPVGKVLEFDAGCQWYVSESNPFVSDEQVIRTDLDEFIVRVTRDYATNEPIILSFCWEAYEKHSAAHINSTLMRPAEMGEAFKKLPGPLPAAIRLGYGIFSGA